MLAQLLFFSFLGSVGGLAGGILLTLRHKAFSHAQSLLMISFAAGVMLAAAFFDLFPEAVDLGGVVWPIVLAGIVFMFFLEKTLLWYHHHGDDCTNETPILLNIGDTLHNFIDGIVMGSAFLANSTVGIVTSLAIMAHEIPHEMADFGVMLAAGWSRRKTILVNVLSAGVSLGGAIGVYYLGNRIEIYVPILLSFAGGMFIYLACSDLIPELHHAHKQGQVVDNKMQMLVFIFGIGLIYVLIKVLEG